jgi:hypothetical protein
LDLNEAFNFFECQQPKGAGGGPFIAPTSKRSIGELFTGKVRWTSAEARGKPLEASLRLDLSGPSDTLWRPVLALWKPATYWTSPVHRTSPVQDRTSLVLASRSWCKASESRPQAGLVQCTGVVRYNHRGISGGRSLLTGSWPQARLVRYTGQVWCGDRTSPVSTSGSR